MNQTLTARRSWRLRAQLAKIIFSKYQQMLHKASEIFWAAIQLFEGWSESPARGPTCFSHPWAPCSLQVPHVVLLVWTRKAPRVRTETRKPPERCAHKKKTTAIFTEDSSPSKSIRKVSMSFASDNCILDGTTLCCVLQLPGPPTKRFHSGSTSRFTSGQGTAELVSCRGVEDVEDVEDLFWILVPNWREP